MVSGLRLANRSIVVAVCALLSVSQLLLAASSEWPQWRGPNRDGVSTETGLLKQWPSDGPPLAWKGTGLGQGYSSLAVAGGRLYTMGDRDGACKLFCLDEKNGKEIWSTRVGDPKGGGGYPGPRATPTIDGELLFALGQHGDLACFETATGKELWRKNYSSDFGGKKDENWGCSESPLVDGEKLIITPGGSGGTMVALNKKTGEVIWKCVVPGCRAGHSSAVIAEVDGIKHYVQLTTGGVIGVNAKDGKLLWRYEKFTNNTANIPTCIVQGDQVFCSAGYENRNGGGALLKLVPTNGGIKAEEIYYEKGLNNKHGGWVHFGGYLFGDRDDRGVPRCIDWKTGQVLWQRERGGGRGNGSAAITYADGHLYIRYQSGDVALVEATSQGYKEKGTFRIPRTEGGPSWPHLVVVNGKLYIREQDQLLCYDVKQK